MQTSNHTEGVTVTWVRPNTSVPWYHEWSGRNVNGYQEFINFFNSNEFDGHLTFDVIDDLTIKATWWFDPYVTNIDAIMFERFTSIVQDIDAYFQNVGIENIPRGMQVFFGAP